MIFKNIYFHYRYRQHSERKHILYLSCQILLLYLFTLAIEGCGGSTVQRVPFKDISREINKNALIYVYHQGSDLFAPRVKIDKTIIGLPEGSYYPFIVSPGKIEIAMTWANAINKNINVNISEGEIVYVKIFSENTPFVGMHADLQQVKNDNGGEEIKSCSLGVLTYGKVDTPKSYEMLPGDPTSKAKICLYRAPNSLSELSIGGWNIGIYSDNDREMIGVALDDCQSFNHTVEPGLVKLIRGNMAFSDFGKATLDIVGKAATGREVSFPGSEFTEIETGVHSSKLSLDFKAEPGRIYYIEHDPIASMFNFVSPEEIQKSCLENNAKVIQHRNSSYIKDLKAYKSPIQLSWSYPNDNGNPYIYSKVEFKGGLLGYLFVEIVKNIRDENIKKSLESIHIQPLVEKTFLERFKENFHRDNIPIASEINVNDTKYDFKAEILVFGITSHHYGILASVVSNQPIAVASIKGTVTDCKTGKVLFRKPFNGFSALPENSRYSDQLEKICRTKLEDALTQATTAFLNDSYLLTR